MGQIASTPAPSHFGQLLRHWRAVHKVSQLALALEADVSARHLSFVETGRSQPSRALVARLGAVLELPLRDRNDLYTAAGFAPRHAETGLQAPELSRIRQALLRILEKQEPYPAIVMDRHWNILMANGATARLIGLMLPRASLEDRPNALRLLFASDGLQPYVGNWSEVASMLLLRLQREALAAPRESPSRRLFEDLAALPVAPADWMRRGAELGHAPVLDIEYVRDGEPLASLFSTLTSIGTPQDITLQELRIESYYPSDDATQMLLESLVPSPRRRKGEGGGTPGY